MSIIRRQMAHDGDRGEIFVSKNPLGHRQVIFDAVCQLFPDEMRERVCHYSTRPVPSPDLVERTHVFKEDNPTFEAELTVSKAGQRRQCQRTNKSSSEKSTSFSRSQRQSSSKHNGSDIGNAHATEGGGSIPLPQYTKRPKDITPI